MIPWNLQLSHGGDSLLQHLGVSLHQLYGAVLIEQGSTGKRRYAVHRPGDFKAQRLPNDPRVCDAITIAKQQYGAKCQGSYALQVSPFKEEGDPETYWKGTLFGISPAKGCNDPYHQVESIADSCFDNHLVLQRTKVDFQIINLGPVNDLINKEN